MTIRAKFKVSSITRQAAWGSGPDKYLSTISMNPVTSNSEENKKFYANTPSGEIKVGVLPQSIADQFEIGDEFYVDFTKAVPQAA